MLTYPITRESIPFGQSQDRISPRCAFIVTVSLSLSLWYSIWALFHNFL